MSSILTNNSAMVALQTLKSINSNLSTTQNQISTGKRVESAKDNSAIWAISKVMESDVAGFKSVSESLSLGSSTVAVARNASEQITDLLTMVKQKVIASQEANVDRTKIQTDIVALREQVQSIVNAAQFNGLNLLQGGEDVTVLSSLDRQTSGVVNEEHITVVRADLRTNSATLGATAVTAGDLMTGTRTGAAVAGNAADPNAIIAFTADGAAEGSTYSISLTGTGAAASDTGGAQVFSYVAAAGDTEVDVSTALKTQLDAYLTDNGLTGITTAQNGTTGELTVALGGGVVTDTITVSFTEFSGGASAGGLAALGSMDVTTDEGANQALADIEALTQTAITAGAQFGSVQGRIEIQSSFISKLSDSLKTGIGSLVDADMEEASARLQALQVQQQLGIQSLSIANQAPQNILALFR